MVIAFPPVDAGAETFAVIVESPIVNKLRVGAPGTIYGIAVLDDDGLELPAEFSTIMDIEYDSPLFKSGMEYCGCPTVPK